MLQITFTSLSLFLSPTKASRRRRGSSLNLLCSPLAYGLVKEVHSLLHRPTRNPAHASTRRMSENGVSESKLTGNLRPDFSRSEGESKSSCGLSTSLPRCCSKKVRLKLLIARSIKLRGSVQQLSSHLLQPPLSAPWTGVQSPRSKSACH